MKDTLIKDVYCTEDYSKFKFLKGNRSINRVNLLKIKKSMEQEPLITVIIVNENMEIIDGQHRFEVSMELGLPIYYIIMPGYGLKECQRLNANASSWKQIDFLYGWADLGNENYIKFIDFMKMYPEFKHLRIYVYLLQGSMATQGVRDGNKFKDGNFKIKEFDEAVSTANKLMDYKICTSTWGNVIFMHSALKIIRLKKYNHERMMKKLLYQTSKIELCANVNKYYDLFSEVYNFRVKDEEKVFLDMKYKL